ncbi:MAG TPA: carboxypeptidase-like regulatory domain-containing protein [Gaiellaceae bacterium]|nr:carboxypeptidase-like regulatory domain-containing protein [Gaiellaceae bacterium]
MQTLGTAVVVAVLAATGAAPGPSGLRGLVTKGPITPVCVQGIPCTAPAAGVRLTFRRPGLVRTTLTGRDGRYRILLASGRYSVTLSPGRFGYGPRVVAVPAGRVGVVNFQLDTGIR